MERRAVEESRDRTSDVAGESTGLRRPPPPWRGSSTPFRPAYAPDGTPLRMTAWLRTFIESGAKRSGRTSDLSEPHSRSARSSAAMPHVPPGLTERTGHCCEDSLPGETVQRCHSERSGAESRNLSLSRAAVVRSRKRARRSAPPLPAVIRGSSTSLRFARNDSRVVAAWPALRPPCPRTASLADSPSQLSLPLVATFHRAPLQKFALPGR